ncbi:MAG: hypothetical protein ACREAC_20220 [Blastocatellia bacterium]
MQTCVLAKDTDGDRLVFPEMGFQKARAGNARRLFAGHVQHVKKG